MKNGKYVGMNMLNHLPKEIYYHIYTYLDPDCFWRLKSLSRDLCAQDEIYACITRFRIIHSKSHFIFTFYLSNSYLTRLDLNCCNDYIPGHVIQLHHLKILRFYNH